MQRIDGICGSRGRDIWLGRPVLRWLWKSQVWVQHAHRRSEYGGEVEPSEHTIAGSSGYTTLTGSKVVTQ